MWPLTAEQRNDTVERVSSNISAIAWATGKQITQDIAISAALTTETKAYTAAEVAATTTTGSRPAIESTKAYARKLSELLLEVVSNGGIVQDESVGNGAEEVDLTGSRDFLTKDSAENALKSLLEKDSQIKKIKFSTKSFGRDAAKIAAAAISNVYASLKDADISDIIAGRPEDEALDALRIISAALAKAKLSSLNLSDNALGEKGIRACAEALTSQEALEGLSLQNVGCSIGACSAVAELLTQSSHLRKLHLFNNMSDNKGAQLIATLLARCPVMEDFRMASSRVGPQGGIALAEGLAASSRLVRLDLSDNPLTGEAAPALASCLARQPHLRAVNLNDTSLGDEGVTAVCQALAQSAPELEEVELALNEMTTIGARALALMVAGKTRLSKLNVRENELEDRGAVVLAKGIGAGCPALRSIDACGNQLKRVGAVALARAAAGKPDLELLALDENMISAGGLDEVKEVLTAAGKEKALGSLDENEEEEEEDEEEEEAEDDGLADELSSILSRTGLGA